MKNQNKLQVVSLAGRQKGRNILFLPKYDSRGASSRYRIYQYLPFLEREGIEYTVHPLLPSAYLNKRYKRTNARPLARWRSLALVLSSLASRLAVIWGKLSTYDLIYIQAEALPYLPFSFERRLFHAGIPTIVDYDDAIYANYSLHNNTLVRRLIGAKISHVVANSSHIIVANQQLATWARQFNPNVSLIPTAIDLRNYPLRESSPAPSEQFMIGWIGTPITADYLQLVKRPLLLLQKRHDFTLKVIGAEQVDMDDLKVTCVPWSESTEVTELQTCVVGIMPVPDSTWGQGKSALKLLQYLAAGVVGVASSVGTNCDVIQDGENGFLAATDEEWLEKLSLVLSSPLLRQKMIAAGRRTVESQYSVQVNVAHWIDMLKHVN